LRAGSRIKSPTKGKVTFFIRSEMLKFWKKIDIEKERKKVQENPLLNDKFDETLRNKRSFNTIGRDSV
jgi:tRNA(Phe) wybutosine-synthesizing methylase Tyw3